MLKPATPLAFSYDEQAIHPARAQIREVSDRRRALFLAERMRPDFVYHTAALEGNPFTFPEVKTLLEGITVGGHKVSDEQQVLNLNRALSFVLDLVRKHQFTLNASTACAIQGLVAREEALTWGVFRDGMVSIAGTEHRPPPPQALPELFDQGAAYLNQITDPVLRAFLIFLWGSLNQFFYDGNKRTSRFLANATLMTAGLPPLTIRAKDQLVYNQTMTRFDDTQDGTEALLWLLSYYAQQQS